ncbi:HEAT repeat domain-containing protein [candidate division KSB1 bacterium]|nr:HEAT repeat domain-containing protein [candidate division KSB1 bacterium]
MKRIVMLIAAVVFIINLTAIATEPVPIPDENTYSYNEYLISSLKDKNIGIRTSAAKLLGKRQVLEATDELVDMLKMDKQYEARIVAGLALLEIGNTEVIKVIEKQAKKDRNQTVRHVLDGVVREFLKKSETL